MILIQCYYLVSQCCFFCFFVLVKFSYFIGHSNMWPLVCRVAKKSWKLEYVNFLQFIWLLSKFSCQFSNARIKLSRGEICVANLKAPLRMVWVWVVFENGPFVKAACCQAAQNGPILKIVWTELIKI